MTARLITLFLLLNAALAFWALALDRSVPWPIPGQSAQDPERVALQVRPEAIRIVRESPPALVAADAASTASASAAASAVASAPGGSASSATPAMPSQQSAAVQPAASSPAKPNP